MQHTGVVIEQSHPTNRARVPSRYDVYRMFDNIAGKYDILNRIFSFGQDVVWRKKLARLLSNHRAADVLDLATGTADVLLSAFKYNKSMRSGVGVDMSSEMLGIGHNKILETGLFNKAVLLKADALSIPIKDGSFDATTISFGIRNVLNVEKSLLEMKRVLRPGGKSFVLEFALPTSSILRKMFLIYLRNFIPIIGGLFSGNRGAYKYLNETVETFPYGQEFAALMEKVGFTDVKIHTMTFGVAMIYEGTK
jgi:demethylmenaquinone methyltransferase/2-methoxy-6-polyprenyl-1,4-benzoquinol methylase